MPADDRNLPKRAISGAAKFLIAMGVFLFFPAGTLNFWQGWVFLLIFSACAILITFYFLKHDPKLVESRLKLGPTAEKETSQKIIQTLGSFFTLLLFLIAGLDRRFGWSDVPIWLVVLGNLLVAVGFLVTFLVMRENSFASSTIETRPDQRVISTGPYRLVRHPMYTGGLLIFLFAPFALGSYRALLVFPLILLLILWRLLGEERFLASHLEGYREYCRRTPYHLVPHVW